MLLISNVPEDIAPQEEEVSKEYIGIYEVTAYSSYEVGNNKTASGTIPEPYITVAATKEFPFGTRLYIEDVGEVVVQDRGAFPNNVIDIFIGNDNANEWGRKELKIWILEKP